MLRSIWLAALLCLPGVYAAASPGPLTVFAAASLGGAMAQIARAYEQERHTPVRLALAGSSPLARQIEHGAPADVFVPANAAWADALQAGRLIDAETRFDLVGNRLVLIAHGRSQPPLQLHAGLDLSARLGTSRLAMALVDAVPAGIYGKAALEHLGLWEQVAAKVAQADNVSVALAWVAAGQAPLGIVYSSDVVNEPRVSIVARFPPGSHPPIVYPAAVVSASRHPAARDFLAWLRGPTASTILEAHGFIVPAR
ncbi:MAG: molybdate ABC transporter substrate-binding protein [Burkholderiaceae bacterium]